MAAAKKKKAPTDMSGAVQPTVRRVVTQWTTALIRSAEIQADGGSLWYAANLCEWLLKNATIASGLRTRAQMLLGLDPTFERSGDKRRSGKAVKALEVGEDWWEAYPESELIQLVIWGLLLGVQPARNMGWGTQREDHDGRVLAMLENWHAQHLRYDTVTRTWRIKVATAGTTGETEVELTPGDGEWVLHTPYGKNRPWAMGLWRSVADLALLVEYGWWDWGKVSERAILLVLTCLDTAAAKELQGYTKEARRQLASDIYARGSEAVAALPPGIDLKAVQAAVDANKLQGELIKAASKAITILIRGGNLTTDVSDGGSRAATETQAEVGDGSNLKFDAQSLTTTIHDQSLVWWAQFNYGDPTLAPWPVYPVDPPEDLAHKVEIEDQAFDTVEKAEKQGFEVDRAKFLEEHKITWAKAGQRPPDPVPPPAPPSADPNAPAPAGAPAPPAKNAPNADAPAPPQTRNMANGEDRADDMVDTEKMNATRAANTEIVGRLKDAPRSVIAGGPRTGKSTIAVRAGERFGRSVKHADSLVGTHEWGDDSKEVASWLDEDGEWIVEGVTAVRALRKWLAAHPGETLNATVVYLRSPIQEQSKGQAAMSAGVHTVWTEIQAELAARGITVIERDENAVSGN